MGAALVDGWTANVSKNRKSGVSMDMTNGNGKEMTYAGLLRLLADKVERCEALEMEVLHLRSELDEAKTVKPAEPALLNTKQAAKFLGVAESTLNNDRCQSYPRVSFIRIGQKSVRYSRADLDAYVEERRKRRRDKQ